MARVVLLVVGFLSDALCDIRPRDPEVEADRAQGHVTWDPQRFGTRANRPPVPGYGPSPGGPVHPHVGSPEELSLPSGEFQNYAPRTGNWCGFVHQRTVTTAMLWSSERYVAMSLSPCPLGPPDCRLALYKLASRPVYKESQKTVTSLLWKCCPGYGGHDCEVTAGDARSSAPGERTSGELREGLGDAQPQASARESEQSEDLRWEQRDFQPPADPLGTPQNPALPPHDVRQTGDDRVGVVPVSLPVPPSSGTAPLHPATTALLAQLHPVLEGFNRTLRQLSQEVGRLSQDLDELRRDRKGGASRGRGGARGYNLEARLQESSKQLGQVRALLSARQQELEGRLQSQHASLHHHLTAFKADADIRIGKNQAGLQSLNGSLAEVWLKQRQLEEAVRGRADGGGGRAWQAAAAWQALGSLETKVLSNAAKVAALEDKSERAVRHLGDLQRGLRGLEGRLAMTGRSALDRYADTALDVEAARVATLGRVAELAGNLSAHEQRLGELDSDMRYLQDRLDGEGAPPACDCHALAGAVSELQRGVASAAQAAEESRRAREEGGEGQGPWAGGGHGSLSDLQQGLWQVRESLAQERDRGRVAALNVSQLQDAQLWVQRDVLALRRSDEDKTREMRRLSGSFSSLLKDAIRHSEVLEVLLGEEVLDFKRHPAQKQREYSIPLLRRRLRRIESHAAAPAAPESPVANDDPSAAPSERIRRASDAERGSEEESGGDFRSLGRKVEQLEARLRQLEGHNCTSHNTAAAPAGREAVLQEEVVTLRGGLEEHLRVFQNVFGDAGGHAHPDTVLDLDRLRGEVRGQEVKRLFLKRQRKDEERRDLHRAGMGDQHSRSGQQAKAADLPQVPDGGVAFLASTHEGAEGPGPLVFERVWLNRGRGYSPGTGLFRAPQPGLYLFLLTLDLSPGPAAAVLKRGGAPVASVRRGRGEAGGALTRVCALELRQGELVHLELAHGTLGRRDPPDSTFAGLLVLRTT